TTGRPGSFVVWDLERKGREALADEQLVQAATAWKGCLLLNRPLETVGMCTAIGTTPPGIVADERFWLYSCNR
ncbi:MAG: hypothetical protein N2447_09780, partial [Thermoanaerobaculum sp.]|nr:hypothetical protein [Thermoanaerobaculum sp.]